MRNTAKLRIPMQERTVATVSLKNYVAKLREAGFTGHKHLTGENIELLDSGHVSIKSLGDAHKKLEQIKKESSFERYHLSTEKSKIGVKKLTEFLYNYKDYKEQKSN